MKIKAYEIENQIILSIHIEGHQNIYINKEYLDEELEKALKNKEIITKQNILELLGEKA